MSPDDAKHRSGDEVSEPVKEVAEFFGQLTISAVIPAKAEIQLSGFPLSRE
jgi:hypothetical protein